MKKTIRLAMICLAAVFLGVGCEEDNTIGGKLVDEMKGDDSGTASASISGTWRGKAGTAQGTTVLRLSQSGNSLSGSWTWGANDTRSCSGYRNGQTIYLRDNSSTGDSWVMTLSGDGLSMRGSAQKYGGGSYALSFNR